MREANMSRKRVGRIAIAAVGSRGIGLAAANLVMWMSLSRFTLTNGGSKAPLQAVRLIGATTLVAEVTTALPLTARVDSGAASCSIHCEELEIKDADESPKNNIGKPARILVTDKNGKEEWIESTIVDYVKVRTSEKLDDRYKVSLRLRWEDVERNVLVTLNDRQDMKYPLLLGRNFLRDHFLVDVSLEANDI
jgi:hypothetical protein